MSNETLSSKNILNMVQELISFSKEKSQEKLRKEKKAEYVQLCGNKFNVLLNKCPTLFYKIIDDPNKFELQRLIQMLNLKDKVDNKEITHKNASENLGEKYYNEYVKPNIKKDES